MAVGSEVSKPVFIAVIVAVVLVVGAIGYHFLGPHRDALPDSVRQKYLDHTMKNPTPYTQQMRGSPGPNGTY